MTIAIGTARFGVKHGSNDQIARLLKSGNRALTCYFTVGTARFELATP
jgi:hypothetical protein